MEALKNAYRKAFSHEIDPLLPANIELYQAQQGNVLFASASALDNLVLISSDLPRFFSIESSDYFFMGFWGHGINSHAFYYARVDERRWIYFRLPYGGVYMDNGHMADIIPVFLQRYLQFENAVANKLVKLVAIDSMHMGNYAVLLEDGIDVTWEESMLDPPDFNPLMRLLLPCEKCGSKDSIVGDLGYRVCPHCAHRWWPDKFD